MMLIIIPLLIIMLYHFTGLVMTEVSFALFDWAIIAGVFPSTPVFCMYKLPTSYIQVCLPSILSPRLTVMKNDRPTAQCEHHFQSGVKRNPALEASLSSKRKKENLTSNGQMSRLPHPPIYKYRQ